MGNWNSVMDCTENGFKQINAREHHTITTDIVNVKALCHNSFIDKESNTDTRGEYGRDLICPNGEMTGIIVKQDTFGIWNFNKFINFKIQCAYN